ncbi:divergent polysaccharide deacetylase family protein [Zavarzinia compransoris]|uniref:divergent polysaccharide deacetylase family protein n=1 Tax=Zavarzinia marina TaxID=2911065 RepID=UPI001F2D8FBA|nr:divergent polysaccharide deacetylase family protein [Zavarzinia marina]MCF4164619.1 divergent polysaccharide deacetylase family protein [Zavarzinia marina]
MATKARGRKGRAPYGARGTRRGRTGPLGRPGVRRAIVGAWAVVVAASVGFLAMRAFDERAFVPSQPVSEPSRPPAVAAEAPPSAQHQSPSRPADLPPAARAPLGIAAPVDMPGQTASSVPPPSAVTADEIPYDSRPAWVRFAATPPKGASKPAIAIVIDDVGVAKGELGALLKLEAPVTFAVMGYADNMRDFSRKARSGGHELMVHVPMEPMGKADPGPNALTVGLAPEEIVKRLRWHLDRQEDYVGVNNHMGSRFTADGAGMAVVAAELKQRGLLFLDSRTSADSVGEAAAREAGLPTASRDVFLDNEIGASAIEAQLVLAERKARESGLAIAIGHPHALTVEAIARFMPQAKARGIVFIPLSSAVARRSGLPPPDQVRVPEKGQGGAVMPSSSSPAIPPPPPRPTRVAVPLPGTKPVPAPLPPTPAAGDTEANGDAEATGADGTRSGSPLPPRG